MTWLVKSNNDRFDVYFNKEFLYSIAPIIIYGSDGQVQLAEEVHVEGRESFVRRWDDV